MKTNFSATEENSKSNTHSRLRIYCSHTGHSRDTMIKAMIIPGVVVTVVILLLIPVMAMLIYRNKYLQFKNCREPVQSYHDIYC